MTGMQCSVLVYRIHTLSTRKNEKKHGAKKKKNFGNIYYKTIHLYKFVHQVAYCFINFINMRRTGLNILRQIVPEFTAMKCRYTLTETGRHVK